MRRRRCLLSCTARSCRWSRSHTSWAEQARLLQLLLHRKPRRGEARPRAGASEARAHARIPCRTATRCAAHSRVRRPHKQTQRRRRRSPRVHIFPCAPAAMAAAPEVMRHMPDMRDLRHTETYLITEARGSSPRTTHSSSSAAGGGARCTASRAARQCGGGRRRADAAAPRAGRRGIHAAQRRREGAARAAAAPPPAPLCAQPQVSTPLPSPPRHSMPAPGARRGHAALGVLCATTRPLGDASG